MYSSATAPKVGTPALSTLALGGSRPSRSSFRMSAASSRDSASDTVSTEPRPRAWRLPPRFHMNSQDLAPLGEIARYRPPPSACLPGLVNRRTRRAVKPAVLAIVHLLVAPMPGTIGGQAGVREWQKA